jgi:hypothetical protein
VGEEGVPRDVALRIPDSCLRVVPGCWAADGWDWGYIEPPHSDKNGKSFLVSHGTNIMVQTASLQIVSLATNGRMTPQRIWRMAMHQGLSVPHGYLGFEGIDYGEITDFREQWPPAIPGLSTKQLIGLETLEDIALARRAIIHEGKFWIWMLPDR